MIMGSVTGFKCTRMSAIDTFNSQLEGKSSQIKEFGTEAKVEQHRDMLMMLGNGIRKNILASGEDFSVQPTTLWRNTFEDNLPYKPKDMLVFNMPPNDEETPNITPINSTREKADTTSLKLASQGSSLKQKFANHIKDWHKEYRNQCFTYAGYLKPGKHQMIVYDELNDSMWFKDVLADQRTVPIKSNDGGATLNQSQIIKLIDENGEELIDRDNSVFMNF